MKFGHAASCGASGGTPPNFAARRAGRVVADVTGAQVSPLTVSRQGKVSNDTETRTETGAHAQGCRGLRWRFTRRRRDDT